MAVRAYWQRGLDNYGDKLTPWLIERVTGEPAEFVNTADLRPKLFGVGSLINEVRQSCVVWGTGILSRHDNADSRADYRAVRGPATAQRIAGCGGRPPRVFGDPGVLLPRWIEAHPKCFRIGLVPHYVHYHEALLKYGADEDAVIIDLRGNVESVTRQISACRYIASSSLHGLVAACAFGVPHVRLRFTEPLAGDDSKFEDFYRGIGADCPPTVACSSKVPPAAELSTRTCAAPTVDTTELWNSCPILELYEG